MRRLKPASLPLLASSLVGQKELVRVNPSPAGSVLNSKWRDYELMN